MERPVSTDAGQPPARALVLALCDAYADEHNAQVRQVELIHQLCGAYSVLDQAGPALPGHERMIPAGADGTPLVAEHLATELAPKLRIPIEHASVLIAESVNLVHRHPRLWAATRAARVAVWQARAIARTTGTAGLSRQAADWVDQQLDPALGRLPWGRVRARLAGLILRADVELAAKRAAQAQAQRFVRLRHRGDGTTFVTARTDTDDAHRLTGLLDRLAGHLHLAGDSDELDVLRAKALGALADPAEALALLSGPEPQPGQPGPAPARLRRRTTELVIHYSPGEQVGRCEQLGPVLAEQVRQWLGHDRVIVHPIIDLSDNPAVDSYEVPDPIARIVRWRNPYDVFPWSARTSKGLDLDHTRPYQHGPGKPAGQTNPDNLGPLSRRPHRARTHSGWEIAQPFPGVYEWRSPLGFRYQVDASGSQELRPDQPVQPPRTDGRSHRPALPITIDLGWPRAA